jgi:hypothetical protein
MNEIFVWNIGGLMMTRQNLGRVEEPLPVPFCQPQIPQGLYDPATPAKTCIV